MKAIIFSDSHKNFVPMQKAIEAEGNVSHIIHAGDVQSDVEDLELAYPRLPIAAVKGNNDWFAPNVPDDRVFELGGVRIFLTHGHNYGVKYSTQKLLQKAKGESARIAIFGHTHIPLCEEFDGIVLFNPGAATKGYGVLEAADGKFSLSYKKLPDSF